MTDQVIQNTDEAPNIFKQEEQKVEDPKTPSGVTTITPEDKGSQPDLNAVFADQLKRITDDNGEQKYSDMPTALDALYHSQQYIKTLEKEAKDKETLMTQQTTIEEAIQKLSATKEAPVTTPTDTLAAEDIERIALNAFRRRDEEAKKETNLAAVNKALLGKFGEADKASLAFQEKATTLGLSFDDLVGLAAKSPSAVLEFFGSTGTTASNPTRGTINPSTSFTTQEAPVNFESAFMGGESPDMAAWRSAGKDL